MSEPLDDERAVIGCALLGNPTGIRMLTDDDYVDTTLPLIANATLALIERGIENPGPVLVASELERRGQLTRVGGRGRVDDLAHYGHNFVGANAPWFAENVRARSQVRALGTAATQAGQMSRAETAVEVIDEIVEKFRDDLDHLPPSLGGVDLDLSQYWAETIWSKADKDDEWLIPGLLATGTPDSPGGDRLMITGAEGQGKSQLLYQISGCVAAGLNPWNGARVSAGNTVMVVDCENPEKRVRHGLVNIRPRIARRVPAEGWGRRLNVVRFPGPAGQSLDLLAARDVTRLNYIADQIQPDLIVIGPFYQLMRGDPNKDLDVLQVLAVLNDIRTRHNAALIIEAHSPHQQQGADKRTVRPFGSSVQLRWPDIGFGIRPDDRPEPELREERARVSEANHNRITHMECVNWRGQREDRDWPAFIRYGEWNQLPWVPTGKFSPSVNGGYRIQQELPEEGE